MSSEKLSDAKAAARGGTDDPTSSYSVPALQFGGSDWSSGLAQIVSVFCVGGFWVHKISQTCCILVCFVEPKCPTCGACMVPLGQFS